MDVSRTLFALQIAAVEGIIRQLDLGQAQRTQSYEQKTEAYKSARTAMEDKLSHLLDSASNLGPFDIPEGNF